MDAVYALLFWYDGERNWTIQNVTTIVKPRKEPHEYRAGELVLAKFQGKTYKSAIVSVKAGDKDIPEKVDLDNLLKTSKSPSQILTALGLPCAGLADASPAETGPTSLQKQCRPSDKASPAETGPLQKQRRPSDKASPAETRPLQKRPSGRPSGMAKKPVPTPKKKALPSQSQAAAVGPKTAQFSTSKTLAARILKKACMRSPPRSTPARTTLLLPSAVQPSSEQPLQLISYERPQPPATHTPLRPSATRAAAQAPPSQHPFFHSERLQDDFWGEPSYGWDDSVYARMATSMTGISETPVMLPDLQSQPALPNLQSQPAAPVSHTACTNRISALEEKVRYLEERLSSTLPLITALQKELATIKTTSEILPLPAMDDRQPELRLQLSAQALGVPEVREVPVLETPEPSAASEILSAVESGPQACQGNADIELVPGYDVKISIKQLNTCLLKARNSPTALARMLVNTLFTEEELSSSCARGKKGVSGRPALDSARVDAIIKFVTDKSKLIARDVITVLNMKCTEARKNLRSK
ncbi:protein piccolo-like [Littorina saxatilis]|uniref:protein piccolo-like n=1 Tax=Littorina saxatilis TaxID=31220 RepID=UPI0038B51AAA